MARRRIEKRERGRVRRREIKNEGIEEGYQVSGVDVVVVLCYACVEDASEDRVYQTVSRSRVVKHIKLVEKKWKKRMGKRMSKEREGGGRREEERGEERGGGTCSLTKPAAHAAAMARSPK